MSKTLTINIDVLGSFEQINKGIKNTQTEMSKIQIPEANKKSIEGFIKKFQDAYGQLKIISKDGVIDIANSKDAINQIKEIKKAAAGLGIEFNKLSKMDLNTAKRLFPDSFSKNIEKANIAIKNFYKQIDEISSASNKSESKIQSLAEKITALSKAEKNIKAQKSFKELSNQTKEAEAAFKQATASLNDFKEKNKEVLDLDAKGNIAKGGNTPENIAKEYTDLQRKLNETKTTYINFKKTLEADVKFQELQKIKKQLVDARAELTILKSEAPNAARLTEEAFQQLINTLNQLGIDTSGIENTEQGLSLLKERLDNLDQVTLDNLNNTTSKLAPNLEEAEDITKKCNTAIEDLSNQSDGIKKLDNEVSQLTNRFLYFFSATNAVNLLKRAISSAIKTVKELDETMTAMSVVSKYSINDLWEQIGKYSKEASALGVSINDLYNATTLYVEQGLDMNDALQLGIESLKMARIAGLDAANATDSMTSALRGFNMELNETSAQRISDVYSKLAAISASNVEELSTAMSKTASIAANANMSFENTAAFLAQIIN